MPYLFLAIAIITIIFGLLIWRFKKLDIVAGYDPSRVIDKDVIAKWIGSHLILMGILLVTLALLLLFIEALEPRYGMILFFLTVIIISIRIVIGTKKFEKK